ncbi:MAG: glycoside hydrolase [Acidobacteriia bacterium]|nr:glycoside hydrolase [Terriglobia bacterium]
MNKYACSYSLHTCVCVLLLIAATPVAFGQGSKMKSAYEPIEEQDRDQPIKRDQWFMHGRIVPGESAAALRYRAHLQKMQMRAARIAAEQNPGLAPLAQILAAPAGWVALGPAPLASDASGQGLQDYNWVSGRATAVAIDPADATGNTVFIGGAFGGVWKSTNAGSLSALPSSVTWTPVIDTQASLAAGAIAIQPGNSNPATSVVLVGTGEANGSGDSYFGLGILRSADGGGTWNLISTANGGGFGTLSFAGLGAARMAFSTAQKNTVVAAMATTPVGLFDGEITANTQRGLYSSTDAGQSWTLRTPTDPGGPINPLTSATSVAFNATAGKFFAAVRYHGFYSSTDGATWTRLATQPGGALLSTAACPVNYTTVNPPCPMYRGEIAVVPGRNEMYVWYVDVFETDQGIWKTTNGGSSWTKVTDTGITNCGDSFGCGTSQGSYNLELAAVPNGASNTDLYAGAINVYKCSITTGSPTCNGAGVNTFLNLTHVYGCSAIAKVHPDQHALDFIVAGGKDLMYFANDGGIYRALDGYTDLLTGTCGLTNSFDSLNQTLGSMTQFVSFSQHPTDPHTILGGTQDNGSPATDTAQTSTSWLNVNGGDGGYNEINPNNPTEWFATNTDVSIQRCTLGIGCLSQFFPVVIGNNEVGGDSGAFYTPYILDPQNTGKIIVGTCRVWRGNSDGSGNGWAPGGGSALSPDFEPGGVPPCTGGEINLVKALAAGGPIVGGVSNVIYAATDGLGPAGPGGHIWVTPNAAGGSGTWTDRTGGINPFGYPISGVAIDTSDASGSTAYVTVMGFHTSHVWKTINAGVSWTDFTGNLPDNPANAIVIDSTTSPSTIHVGTDVGVFSSSAASASWTELGPVPGNGPGYLPNVPVTALRIFNSGGSKLLRASTYGRGVWEFALVTVPDYTNVVSNPTLTIFPTQNATFNGTLTALGGYNTQVTLSCTGTPPGTCTPSPTKVTPTPAPGATYTVTATGAIGDYSFNAHATDGTLMHDAALTLHVVDFGIGTLSPNSVTVNRPSTSQAITFQVTGSGSFNGTVSLSCSGLPAFATCNFSPSSAVNPTAATPVTVTLTIRTTTSTPTGVSTVAVTANTAGAPAAKTQNLSLTVTANPDYVLALSNSSASAAAGSQTTFNGTLTSVNGYSSVVNINCGAGGPPTCPQVQATPTAGGAAFMLTVGSATVQTYNFNVTAVGTDGAATTHISAATFNSTFDYTIADNSGPQTVAQGSPATFMIGVTPTGTGNTFPAAASLTCSGLPAHSSCSSTPLVAGSGAGTVTLTINTIKPTFALRRESRSLFYALWLPLPGLVLIFGGLGRRNVRWKRSSMFLMLTLVPMMVGLQVACGGGGGGGGGGGNPGTTKGTFTVTVTATSAGSPTHSVPVTLTVQ